MGSIKWTDVEHNLEEKPTNRICVGHCTVSVRAHFARKKNFEKSHFGYNSAGKLWFKGRCGGHPLNRGSAFAKRTEIEGQYHAGPEWHEIEKWTPKFASRVREEAVREEIRLSELAEVRFRLCAEAPKKVLKQFDLAVANNYLWKIAHIRRRYGV